MAVDPIAFIRQEIRLPDGRTVGDALPSDPWIESELLAPVFARQDGLPRHKLIYLELPRGHWKSGGAASIACAESVLYSSTDVVIAASDVDQAKIITDNLNGYLDRNPALKKSFRVAKAKDTWTVPSRGSRIRVVSSDVASSWGHGGTHKRFRVIADELTVWKLQDLWTSLVSATGKVQDVQTIILSNAGYDAEHSWQYKVREQALTQPWGYLFTTDGPIASWITPEWLEMMRTLLPPSAYERVIENRWVSEQGDFVSKDQWERCIDYRLVPQQRGKLGYRYFGGWDLGINKDRCAISVVHVDSNGLLTLDNLLVWTPDRKHEVDISRVEATIVHMNQQFPDLRIYADKWQAANSLQRLRRERVKIKEYVFSQSSVARLSQILYNLVITTGLRVYDDPELTYEILNMRVVNTASGWKIDHQPGKFSDRVIALALACMAALESVKAPITDLMAPGINDDLVGESAWNIGGSSIAAFRSRSWEAPTSNDWNGRLPVADPHGPLGKSRQF